MNRRAYIKYAAVILALLNMIWMLGFGYSIPGVSGKSNTPEYTVADTSSMTAIEAGKKDDETVEAGADEDAATARTEEMAAKHKRCRVIQGIGLNVRSGPGPKYDIVTTVAGGTEMECLDDGEGSWIHVRTPDGKEGYVSKGYVEMLDD